MPPSKGQTATAEPEQIPADNAADWEEIQPFTEPRQMNDGEEIVAVYLGGSEVEVPARADDDDESITVNENGKRVRRAMLHEFQDGEGTEPFGIWGSAVLDKRLADVPPSSRVKIRYDGKQNLEGGRTARRYRVWVDKSASFS